jgi:hypothetical protein
MIAGAPPDLLFTTCPSLKRLCLDVLVESPHVKLGGVPLDVEEAVFQRVMFPSCVMQTAVSHTVAPLNVNVITLFRVERQPWVGFVVSFLTRFLGARVRLHPLVVSSPPYPSDRTNVGE